METGFFIGNRQDLYETLENGSVFLSFAGVDKHRTADANYIFFPNRNFVYLTGLDGVELTHFILMAEKTEEGVTETIFSLPPDMMLERWNGRRLKAEEITQKSGIENIKDVASFDSYFHDVVYSGKIKSVVLDLCKEFVDQDDDKAHKFAKELAAKYPGIKIDNCHRQLRKQRTYKKPCEIQAMRKAIAITKSGIEAMMKSSKPGMYEYEYKAEFDYQLTKQGVLEPGFLSIISAGDNNFSIHYYGYQGQAKDGDMVLNDVGAIYDGICCDISRGWPCNGIFDERQRLLYECAYKTSEYLFGIIKPGMVMRDVDRLSHEYCAKELVKIGLLDDVKNVKKYMWHGGAHHVGYDVHDQIAVDKYMEANMIFCVDVGIYVEEWGIGFRLEDNCLVTETGCENLSASVPRTIEEIEALMRKSK